MQPTGKREIAENVLTAILCTIAASLIEMGVSSYRERRKQAQEAQQKTVKPKRNKTAKSSKS